MRNSIRNLKEEMARYLKAGGGFTAARVMTADPSVQRDYPLKKPVVAVGLEGVELASPGLGNYWGERPGREESLYGSAAAITLRFDLYCPTSEGGDGCHSLYEDLCDRLMPGDSPFHIIKVWCGQTEWDKSAGANHLRAYASLRAGFTVRDDTAPIDEFIVIREQE